MKTRSEITGQTKKLAAGAVERTRHTSKRARHQMQLRRIDTRIRQHEQVIGHLVYQRLVEGQSDLEIPEVQARVAEIAALLEERAALQPASQGGSATTEPTSVAAAHLYEALTHRLGPVDFAADHPLTIALSRYGETCRNGDEDGIRAASDEVYEALTQHFGVRDFGADEPIVVALSEYGAACRDAGPR
ncbi:MAG: hypothetical protein ACSLFM_02125 [Tepidiformaceae bacterium]